MSEFTKLWDTVQATDPKHTKGFSRGGGFKGTAVNATWLEHRATEQFGPKGIGWGVEVEDEKFVNGHSLNERGDNAIIHVLRVRLWYMWQGVKGEVIQYGQTTMVGANKNGLFTDEEAPKKSLTDATTKALSGLGFSADIFMGLYEDNKYVAEMQKQFSGPLYSEEQKRAFDDFLTGSALGLAMFRRRVGDDIYTDLYNSFDKEKVKNKKLAEDQEKIGIDVFNAVLEKIEAEDSLGVKELLEDETKTVIALLKSQLTGPQRKTLDFLLTEEAA